jgi:magnesium transporter
MERVKVELIRKLLRGGATQKASRIVDRLDPADLADLFGALSPGETVALIDLLFRRQKAALTLMELPPELLRSVVEGVEDRKLSSLVSRLPPDDGALLLLALPKERQAALLEQLPSTIRAEVEPILLYPEKSAGRLMNTRFVAVDFDSTAAEAIERLRARPSFAESAIQVYVVDAAGHLVGSVSLPKLLLADPSSAVKSFTLADTPSVQTHLNQEEVARLVARYDLLSLPVTDEQHRLVGVITVDDVIDVIQEEATEDIYRMAGLDEGDRVFSPTLASVRRRLPWNLLNLVTAMVAANVVGLFEGVIVEMVALATFMPVVAGMGGNTGNQALTVVTRGIALGELSFSSALKAVTKELTVGLCIGVAMGIIVGTLGWVWKGDARLGLVLCVAMVCNLTISGLVGAAIPLLLERLEQDPALGGGIVLTAITDTFGFFVFLSLASAMLT